MMDTGGRVRPKAAKESRRINYHLIFLALTGCVVALGVLIWSLWHAVDHLAALQALTRPQTYIHPFEQPDSSSSLSPNARPGAHTQSSTPPASQTTEVSNARPETHTQSSLPTGPPTTELPESSSKRPDRLAFATFLAKNTQKKTFSFGDDMYFITVRILAYQLLHDHKTRSEIPFLVLVAPEVSSDKRERLARDGATVVPVQHLKSWAAPKGGTWKYVFDKMQLFNMTDYDKILFMDADTVLRARISGVFEDQAAQVRKTLHRKKERKKKEAPLPSDYLLAAKFENSGHATKRWLDRLLGRTQRPKDVNYLNAGFFVLKPSREIYQYYLSLMKLKGRFSKLYPEQNMLNYAHRRYGNMPWTSLQWDWNVHSPSLRDFHLPIKSLHGHLWDPGFPFGMSGARHKFWVRKKKEMERFFAKQP